MKLRMSETTKDRLGMGTNGKPRFGDREIPSIGTTSSLPGAGYDGSFVCLSQGERNFALILMYDNDVARIETQVLLNKEDTDELAKMLGYRRFNNGRSAMTTDFLVTMKDKSLVAYSVKASRKDMEDKRTQEKFEMEKRYWEARGIECRMVYKEDLDPVLCSNLADVFSAYDPRFLCDENGWLRHMIARKIIKTDMTRPLDYEAILKEEKENGNWEKALKSARISWV